MLNDNGLTLTDKGSPTAQPAHDGRCSERYTGFEDLLFKLRGALLCPWIISPLLTEVLEQLHNPFNKMLAER
jgi:hypothetical protein